MYHDNHRRTRQLGILRIVGRQERPASRPISDVRPTVAIRPKQALTEAPAEHPEAREAVVTRTSATRDKSVRCECANVATIMSVERGKDCLRLTTSA